MADFWQPCSRFSSSNFSPLSQLIMAICHIRLLLRLTSMSIQIHLSFLAWRLRSCFISWSPVPRFVIVQGLPSTCMMLSNIIGLGVLRVTELCFPWLISFKATRDLICKSHHFVVHHLYRKQFFVWQASSLFLPGTKSSAWSTIRDIPQDSEQATQRGLNAAGRPMPCPVMNAGLRAMRGLCGHAVCTNFVSESGLGPMHWRWNVYLVIE